VRTSDDGLMVANSSAEAGSPDVAKDLLHYLHEARAGLLSRVDGLGEYDLRRPMTPTATNLLGLVKHLAGIELSYLGDCVGRPSSIRLPWVEDGSIWDDADMWATPDESSAELIDLYRAAGRHADKSVEQLGLAAPATVPWWPEHRRDTRLGTLLVRVVAETAQHAGHADIVRELIDGTAGQDGTGDGPERARHRERVQRAADAFPS
jgi:Protein of unknown function (DUF664)